MLRPAVFHDSLFDDFFDDMFVPQSRQTRKSATMSTDIRETADGYQIEMELPGYTKDDVTAQLKDGYLTVDAAHTENREEKNKEGRYIRKERYTGSYSRSFYVGEDITEQDITAKFTDGILTLTVPKKEAKPQAEEKKFIRIDG